MKDVFTPKAQEQNKMPSPENGWIKTLFTNYVEKYEACPKLLAMKDQYLSEEQKRQKRICSVLMQMIP
ncbi:MAG TPA: hypothetical protein VLG38_01940 [Gammaproteobacteria bacterium]|nr:hypothetical protein [Gammaproteobacteria bacterium]